MQSAGSAARDLHVQTRHWLASIECTRKSAFSDWLGSSVPPSLSPPLSPMLLFPIEVVIVIKKVVVVFAIVVV